MESKKSSNILAVSFANPIFRVVFGTGALFISARWVFGSEALPTNEIALVGVLVLLIVASRICQSLFIKK